jgi:hypothetical protein
MAGMQETQERFPAAAMDGRHAGNAGASFGSPSHSASAGRTAKQRVARSKAAASRNTSRSRPRRPTICRPTDNPEGENPHGTLIAGNPVQLIA